MDTSVPSLRKQLEDPLWYLPISAILSYTPGEFIFAPGDPATHIYLVMSGEVKVGRSSAARREIITNFYGPDSVFGESTLIQVRHSSFAVALETTQLMAWKSEQIEALGREHPQLSHALLQIMVERLSQHEQRIQSFTTDDARRRLLRALLSLSSGKSKDSESQSASASAKCIPPLTHESLAAYIGASREVVTQLMNLFRRQGYLTYSRKGIMLFPGRIKQDEHTVSSP